MAQTDNGTQRRPKCKPPVVVLGLANIRKAMGLKQTDVCAAVAEITGESFTPGALSAIETGTRGASPQTLTAIEAALSLPVGALHVSYDPSHNRRKASA